MNEEKWRINKSLSVWHMIGTAMLIVGGFTFIYDLRERISLAEFQIDSNAKRMERMDSRNKDQFSEIMNHLYRLENKIDNLLSGKTFSIEQKG